MIHIHTAEDNSVWDLRREHVILASGPSSLWRSGPVIHEVCLYLMADCQLYYLQQFWVAVPINNQMHRTHFLSLKQRILFINFCSLLEWGNTVCNAKQAVHIKIDAPLLFTLLFHCMGHIDDVYRDLFILLMKQLFYMCAERSVTKGRPQRLTDGVSTPAAYCLLMKLS